MRELTLTVGCCLGREIVHRRIWNPQHEAVGQKKMIERRYGSSLVSVYERMICYQRVEQCSCLIKDRRENIVSKC